MMNYTVVGAGAIGGYYGCRLAHAGRQVRFLSHSDYAYVKEHGFRIDSCDGDFSVFPVEVYAHSADIPQSDVVLVGLKSVNNHLLPELLAPILHDDTIVVLIQNGIGLEEDLQHHFPHLQIVAGLAFICSAKTAPGRVSHQCYGSINLGNYSCPDERFHALLADFIDAGLEAAEVPYLEDQMMEVIGAANALGVNTLTCEFADKMMAMTDAMVPYSPSMKLDFDFHRPMEIPYLYTRPIAEAKKVGFDMPKLAMLEAELRFIQSQYLVG